MLNIKRDFIKVKIGIKMKTFRLLNSKKGISPILATLLLIVIAVAAISITYAWVTTYMGNTTDKAGVMLYEANVNFQTGNPNTIVVDVGNSGTSDAHVVSIYVGNSSATMQSYSFTGAKTIAADKSQSFTISSTDFGTNGNWAANTYYFKVVVSSGSPLTFNENS